MPDPTRRHAPHDRDATLLQRGRVLEGIAGSAWHELAQPLSGLRGFVTMLRMEGWSAEQLGVDPGLIDDATASVERLARALTDLARGSSRAVPLDQLVTELVALAGHMLMDVEVANEIPADAPELDVDPATLRVVVASLLLDSLHALGGPRAAAGTVRWSATPTPDGQALEARLEDDAPTGVPEDLPLVRALLRADGATLAHEAAGVAGNRYTLILPIADPPPLPAAPDPEAADLGEWSASDAGPRLTVLVCDDEEQVRRLLARILQRMGHRVVEAGSGAEALVHLDREPVDVVMADHHMAGMTGLQLHTAAVARRPELLARFVLMSGDAQDAQLLEFARLNGLVVLSKPFDIRALPATIRSVAAR